MNKNIGLNRNFVLFCIGTMLIFASLNMQVIVRGWYVNELTNSPLLVSLIIGLMFGPMFILSLLSGAITDKFNRRITIIIGDATFVLLFILIPILDQLNILSVWLLFIITILNGIAHSFTITSRQTAPTTMVSPQKARLAIGIYLLCFNLGLSLGPLILSILLGFMGEVETLYVSGALAGIGWIFNLISHIDAGPMEKTSIPKEIAEGFDFLIHHKWFIFILITAAIMTLTVAPYQAVLPFIASDIVKTDSQGLSTLATASGVGSLVGAICTVIMGRKINFFKWGGLIGILCAACLLLFVQFSEFNFSISILTIALTQFLLVFYMTLNLISMQLNTPLKLRGRAASFRFVVISIVPISGIIIGLIAENVNIKTTLTILTIIAISMFVLTFIIGQYLYRRKINLDI